MRKFHDYHDSRVIFLASGSTGIGPMTGTAINAAGFGRARFIFVLGPNAANATWSGSIFCGTSAAAIVTPITIGLSASSGFANSMIVVDTIISQNAVGSAYSWLQVSDAIVGAAAWNVSGLVDLYNSYIHPPATTTPRTIITI
jgi:hypothetical protein